MNNLSNISLQEAKLAVSEAVSSFKIGEVQGSPVEFQELANGLFQAEGYVGIQILEVKALSVTPIMSVNQLYSPSSLSFFVRLSQTLGSASNLYIFYNDSGKLMIMFKAKG